MSVENRENIIPNIDKALNNRENVTLIQEQIALSSLNWNEYDCQKQCKVLNNILKTYWLIWIQQKQGIA